WKLLQVSGTARVCATGAGCAGDRCHAVSSHAHRETDTALNSLGASTTAGAQATADSRRCLHCGPHTCIGGHNDKWRHTWTGMTATRWTGMTTTRPAISIVIRSAAPPVRTRSAWALAG